MKLAMMSCVMDFSPEEIVRTARECGLDAIDWVCPHTAASPKKLRKLSADFGLKVIAHTVIGSPFERREPGALDDFKRSLEFACELEAPVIMLPPFPRRDQISAEDDRKAWTGFYGEILPLAQAAGKILTAESTGFRNSPVTTAEEMLELLHAVPGLMCTLDFGNMETAAPALHAYELLKEYAVQFHWKDWKIRDVPFPGAEQKRCGRYFANAEIGTGDMDLKAIWNTLDERGRGLYGNLETKDYAGSSSTAAVLKRVAGTLKNW